MSRPELENPPELYYDEKVGTTRFSLRGSQVKGHRGLLVEGQPSGGAAAPHLRDVLLLRPR